MRSWSTWVLSTLGAIVLVISTGAYADGSVSFKADIAPFVNQRPFFADFIARSFTLTTDTGWGVRIDSPTMPDMSGARIGPYQFQAIWHSPKGDVPVTLIIDTDVKYFDAKGQEILSGDLTKTEKITESLSSVEVEPARK